MSLKENWTRDAGGNYVDWTKPPYRPDDSGMLYLVLEGEDASKLTAEIRQKRIAEYYALCRRNFKKRPPRTPSEHRDHAIATVRGIDGVDKPEEPGAE